MINAGTTWCITVLPSPALTCRFATSLKICYNNGNDKFHINTIEKG